VCVVGACKVNKVRVGVSCVVYGMCGCWVCHFLVDLCMQSLCWWVLLVMGLFKLDKGSWYTNRYKTSCKLCSFVVMTDRDMRVTLKFSLSQPQRPLPE
jgi:hypothetical protein